MPLINIPYQPFAFNPVRPTDCFALCDGREDYCMPVIPGDSVEAQFTQTPCGPSIACDGDFSAIDEGSDLIPDGDFNALGEEEMTNGTFTGDASGWTLSNFAYGTNNVSKTAGSSGSIDQFLDNATGVNEIYKVVYTVSGYAGGGASVSPVFYNGGTTITGTGSTADGTFTLYMKVTGGQQQFSLSAQAGWAGTIDNVSVKRIAASWEFGGDLTTGWLINSSGFASITGGQEILTCAGILQPNTNYILEIEFETGTNGLFLAQLGGTNSLVINQNGAGTHTEQITSGAGADFVLTTPFQPADGVISSISIIEVSGDCWEFDTDLWTITTNALCKTPGTSDTLINSATLTGGQRYQVKITVNGMTAGSLQMTVNLAPGALITSNNTYVQYFNPVTDSNLEIFVNNLFDGCISNVEIFELRNDYLFEIRDLEGNTVAIISDNNGNQYGRVKYHDDYVTIKFKLDEILDINDHALNFGCYQIWCFDLCEIQYEEVIVDGEFANPFTTYWFDSGGSPEVTNTITTGELIFDNATVGSFQGAVGNKWDGSLWQGNPGLPLGPHNYRISFEITENNDPANITVGVTLGNLNGFSASTVGVHTQDVFNVNPVTSLQQFVNVLCSFNGVTGHVKVDNVSVHRIEPFDETFVSACFKYAANFPCTKVIKSHCRADAFGFKFIEDLSVPEAVQVVIFELYHRVEINAGNDSFPESTDDYLFSTGTKQRNYGQSETVYTVVTGDISRDAHACIRLQRICQFFYIGEPLGEFIQWFCLPGDYNPEWDKRLKRKLTFSRFEVQRKDQDVKFFRRS